MNRSKILVVLVVLLLIANAALLYLYLKKDHMPKRGEGRKTAFREQLKKDAGFSDEQMTRFGKMREEHRRNMEPWMDSIGKLRAEMFTLSTGSDNDSAVAAAVARLSDLQGKIDLQMVKNFRETRSICNPGQLPQFDSAMKKMMVNGRKKMPPPGKEKR